MVRKIRIKESVNTMNDSIYDNLALLGYTCSLAANDLHHIHLCATGDKFQEIHECADKYLDDVREFGDICLELAKEGNISLLNETYALEVLKDNGGSDWQVADKDFYNFEEAFTQMSNILSDLTQGITLIEDMDGVTSDVVSVLDEWARKFSKEVNYFIAKKLSNEEILVSQTESVKKRNRKVKESVSKKDIKTVMKAAVDVSTKDELTKVLGSLLSIDKQLYLKYCEMAKNNKLSPAYIGKKISDDLYYVVNESVKGSRKGSLKESYKDSPYYKKLADYDYICEVEGNTVTIKWTDDGSVYAKFTLTSPEEVFADTDIDPHDDLSKAYGWDGWFINDGNGPIDTSAKTYDDAVVAAIRYFWNHY